MAENEILEPLKEYPSLKEKVKAEAEKTFDSLISEAKTNVGANQATIKEYKNEKAILEHLEKKLSSEKGKHGASTGFGIFFIVLAAIMIIISILCFTSSMTTPAIITLIIGILSIPAALYLLIGLRKRFAARIDKLNAQIEEQRKKVQSLYTEGLSQMASANALFDFGMPQKVISTAVPLIQLDQNLGMEKYTYLTKNFGVPEIYDEHTSVELVQSGSIVGNPFVFQRVLKQTMPNKIYSGSITIHWVTYTRGKNGTQAHHHTQVLTATISRPAPSYHEETFLVYGNEAAPKLKFSRSPQLTGTESEKKIDKVVSKGAKKAANKAERDLMDQDASTNFTAMQNDEFEVLFHAWDRSDEAQFRLLFTPLAQQNMIGLIKSKEPYGDDFHFTKENMVNVIGSAHAQSLDFDPDPGKFMGFDHDAMREKFVNYTLNYFQGIYFDLAPLLSIPLYQQHKPRDYIYGEAFKCNVSPYEQEVMANTISDHILKPEDCCTSLIKKVNLNTKNGSLDEVEIIAHGFRGEPRVEVVMLMGGDGHMHAVPVNWIEYFPVSKATKAKMTQADSSRNYLDSLSKNQGFNNLVNRLSNNEVTARFAKRLFVAVGGNILTKTDVEQLDSLLNPSAKKKKENLDQIFKNIKKEDMLK